MGTHRKLALLLLFALSGAGTRAFAFNVYKVDPTCGAPGAFTTIQAAVDAAAAHTGEVDYVWISHDGHTQTYAEHVVVNDPDGVIIEGGFNDCFDFDPGTDQTSVGPAGDGGPVFDIVGTGHAVSLSNLFISGARRGAGDIGGGIDFIGQGELDLAQTTVFDNRAGYGGGVNVSASGGQAVLQLLHDTTFYLNEAYHSGGAIRLDGDARLIAADSKIAINGNTAAEYGGGILVLGPARADIGSADGGFGAGVVAANRAANGGGVAAIDDGNGEAVLRVFADAAQQPSSFVDNRATSNGGGVYLTGAADACLFSAHFAGNVAEDGAAVYHAWFIADGSGNHTLDGGVYINGGAPARLGSECGPETVAALGGTTTCFADACSTFTGHATRHADDTPSAGSVFYLYLNELIGSRLRIQHSSVANVIYGGSGKINLSTCLITDNGVSGNLIAAGQIYPGYTTNIARCTIANNTIDAADVIDLGQTMTGNLAYDIFDQPGKPAAVFGPGDHTLDVSYTMAADAVGLPTATNPGVVQARPDFVDAASGDYRLLLASHGVDFAPSIAGSDLDGAPRSIDLAAIANKFGPVDLGAYERQSAFACDASADALFCDGFGP